jgi:hypothetical protein
LTYLGIYAELSPMSKLSNHQPRPFLLGDELHIVSAVLKHLMLFLPQVCATGLESSERVGVYFSSLAGESGIAQIRVLKQLWQASLDT